MIFFRRHSAGKNGEDEGREKEGGHRASGCVMRCSGGGGGWRPAVWLAGVEGEGEGAAAQVVTPPVVFVLAGGHFLKPVTKTAFTKQVIKSCAADRIRTCAGRAQWISSPSP